MTPPPLPKTELLCVVRSLLKKMEQRVLVGDRVSVTGIDWADGRGMVADVLPRHSISADPAVANVDHQIVAIAFARPPAEPFQMTKFLLAAEAASLPLTLLLTKSDLVSAEERAAVVTRLRSWGYDPLCFSAVSLEGLQAVGERLRGRVSVVAGPSGVGKSSLINALRLGLRADGAGGDAAEEPLPAPGADIDAAATARAADPVPDDVSGSADWGECAASSMSRTTDGSMAALPPPAEVYKELATQAVSLRGGRGTHTTRNISLLQLPGGGLLADTPGFNMPALEGLTAHQLPHCFPEIQQLLEAGSCGFRDCTHDREPKCAVNSVEWERYPYYLRLLREVREREEKDVRTAQLAKKRREGNLKVKSGRGGVAHQEVRLDSKKHRRVSRKQRKQDMLASLNDR